MNKIKTWQALGLLLLAVVLNFHCKKDDDDAPSRTAILTSGTWRISAHTVNPATDWNGDGIDETDIYAVYEACEKDDYFTFKTDGVLEVNEGPTKCDPSYPQIYSMPWAFANNDNQLIVDGDNAEIIEFTSTNFKIRVSDFGYVMDVTFTKR